MHSKYSKYSDNINNWVRDLSDSPAYSDVNTNGLPPKNVLNKMKTNMTNLTNNQFNNWMYFRLAFNFEDLKNLKNQDTLSLSKYEDGVGQILMDIGYNNLVRHKPDILFNTRIFLLLIRLYLLIGINEEKKPEFDLGIRDYPMGECVLRAIELRRRKGGGEIYVFQMTTGNTLSARSFPQVTFTEKDKIGQKLNNHVVLSYQDNFYDPLKQVDTYNGINFFKYIYYLVDNLIDKTTIKHKYLIIEGQVLQQRFESTFESTLNRNKVIDMPFIFDFEKYKLDILDKNKNYLNVNQSNYGIYLRNFKVI